MRYPLGVPTDSSISLAYFFSAAQPSNIASESRGTPLLYRDQWETPDYLSGEYLNIMVPGPDAIEEAVDFLVRKGYLRWKSIGLDNIGSIIGPSTFFVVGSRRSDDCPRERSITIAYGSSGSFVSTIPSPLGDNIAFISASRIHRADAPRRMFPGEFHYSWTLKPAPWSNEHNDYTPPYLLESTCGAASLVLRQLPVLKRNSAMPRLCFYQFAPTPQNIPQHESNPVFQAAELTLGCMHTHSGTRYGVLSPHSLRIHLASFMDFETLVKLARVSKGWQLLVRNALRELVIDAVAPFLQRYDIPAFFRMLYMVNGVIFGHLAQQVACPGTVESMRLSQVPHARPDCRNHLDMNILVPGLEQLRDLIRWLSGKGYVHWRAYDSPCGLLGPTSQFVAGVRTPKEVIAPTTRSITIAFGSVGVALSTLPAPLGDKFGIISASHVHRVRTAQAQQATFDYSWLKFSAPWSFEHCDHVPEHLIKVICKFATRHSSHRQCRNGGCRDHAAIFRTLQRVRRFGD
ncbi:hypothetical protein NMY22_g269 [Coprinellus aureogranulatus]|nr:hypothetical protein NMY22_g269 [Coprinellus aureogranulatus]